MYGEPKFRLGSFRTDRDRLEHAANQHKMLDSCPNEPEHKNWRMRERQRQNEIGPEFRMSHTLQIERVLGEMKRQGTGKYFKN